uniref:Nitrile-specifier protein 5 n=1 Tax=Ananas comosus var. bracteatus TaxID=296719 RepID=A0A6V7PE68_ANACO|nr:unnamed protein product [Ananas comosus var. bracteatus]
MAADDRRVYVFGGCGNAGRLNDLWVYDTNDKQWIQYPAPGDSCRPRGGPGLAVAGEKIWVVYGFSGAELDDVHCFDLVSEVDPSDLGHLGAGKFSSEAFALDSETCSWIRLKDEAEADEHPGPRGWCAFSAGEIGGKRGLLVYGGNSPTNDRLDDIFFFTPSM